MKIIVCVILATLLTSCADMDPERKAKFMQGFAAGMNYRNTGQQNNLSAQALPAAQSMDLTCYNECMRSGTAYGLCKKNCSY